MKNRNGILLGLRAIGNVGLCATHTGTASPDAGAGGIGDLSRDFDYDALYRLLYATGRENQPTSTNPYFNRERSHTASSTNNYSQKYSYDQMGNILKLKHENTDSGPGNFVRTFNDGLTYGSTNKLASVTIGGGTPWGFTYDGCGNQTQQTIDRNMQWDYADRLYSFYIQTGLLNPANMCNIAMTQVDIG
jgi:YD repeat-containing protein